MKLKLVDFFTRGIVKIDQVIFEIKGDNYYGKDKIEFQENRIPVHEHILCVMFRVIMRSKSFCLCCEHWSTNSKKVNCP